MLQSLLLAAETASEGGINPIVVGALSLGFLLLLLFGLLAFAAGRDHS
ncbi:hypothetical protein [Nocardioides massiliensis]|uniref:Uncharacterized protein n=1 Tax=Nocardioides massiliensis TaxID=1325935 RepID=A0ABT9NPM9_9ACTN|nr:hypothetical protein [Nocardioides massiliensis]MDP9822381.1 hypothetical protein [Nocardioides massiliensis]